MNNSKNKKGVTRRKFLIGSSIGVGVLLGAGYLSRNLIRRYIASMVNEADMPYNNNVGPSVWFEITADNKIILHSPKVEMGQGTFTGLAQIAAEELEVDLSNINVVHASTATSNIDPFATGGSTSISGLWQPLRELAATMREMLKIQAAQIWDTERSSISAADGQLSFGSKSMSYGELVAQVKEWEVPDTPPLKDVSSYKYVGKPIPRIDLMDKVIGAPIFGMDATMPDMLYGAVVRPDRIGATFGGADVSAARDMPGVVKIVEEEDFIGVVATSRMAAEEAKNAIKVDWKTDKNWTSAEIVEMLEVGQGNPIVIQKQGDPADHIEDSQQVITAEYRSPIGAHAQIEPNGSVSSVTDEGATIKMSTQVVKITRKEVAKRLGMDEEDVVIEPTYLGGGFGRRLHTPNAIQTAVMSKAVGKPVASFYTRKEEFQNDTFRPPTHHVLKAVMTEDGKIDTIEHNVSSGDVMFGSALVPGFVQPVVGADVGAWRGGMIQYEAIPNFHAISWRVKLPFATSWWRSLGLLANTFAIECFLDELAVQTKQDPVQFRLDHIQDDDRGYRLKEVIKAAAKRAGYRDEVVDGVAMGFAASTDANTPVAQVAAVAIVDDEIKVLKVTCVIDPGLAVNPDQVRAQCEGSIIMGMSAAMYEKMEVVDGQLYPVIYGPYRMALMKDAPKKIDVEILQNAETPGAVGEPPLGPIGAAIANAIFRLTGERRREMPLVK